MIDKDEKLRVPDKFIKSDDGSVDIDKLVNSYVELERMLSNKDKRPAYDPADDDFEINPKEFEVDEEVNQRLRDAGLTSKQIALVYEIGEDKILPAMYELIAEVDSYKERQALIKHFGSEDKYRQMIEQISGWAGKNVRPEVVDSLGCSCDGVLALLKMMDDKEPRMSGNKDAEVSGRETLDDLRKIMAGKSYWRDKDPTVVSKVQEGFKRLYDDK